MPVPRRLAAGTLALLAGLTALTAVAAPAQAGLKNAVRVTHWTPLDVSATKQWHVACPEGKKVISGGAEIDGPDVGRISLLRPNPVLNQFEAAADMPQLAEPWRLIVYAVCATPPPQLSYQVATSVALIPNGQSRIAIASCPKGTRVIGLGARAAVERERHVELEGMHSFPDLSDVLVWSHSIAPVGEKQDWTAEAYAVCAAVPDAIFWDTWYPFTFDHGNRMNTDCPKTFVTGAGFEISTDNAHGWVWLHDIIPADDLRTAYIETHKSMTNTKDEWFTIASVSCAP